MFAKANDNMDVNEYNKTTTIAVCQSTSIHGKANELKPLVFASESQNFATGKMTEIRRW